MEFVTGICPKCKGQLQIPEDREKILCMYCGEEIETKEAEALWKLEDLGDAQADRGEHRDAASKELTSAQLQQHQEYRQQALELLPQMLLSIKDPLKDFKKGMYEPSFRTYLEEHTAALNAIEDAYMSCQEPEALLEELAEALVEQSSLAMTDKNKRRKEEALMNYNMSLVIYVNPALLEQNRASGQGLVEAILRKWKLRYPKTDLKASNFEDINNGFKRRFCYITTAVCQSLGRPDDCYELNTLRDYRDHYLLEQENGEELVRQYYDVAPTIVKHIDRRQECQEIYQGIWKQYLSPCIQLIEEQEPEQCSKLYQTMMEDLSERYFH